MSPDSTNVLRIVCGVAVPLHLIEFTFSRSGGPGGQSVNKLSTKATLSVRVDDLTPHIGVGAAARLGRLAGGRITEDGRLVLHCDESRSQHANKQACLERLRELIVRARQVPRRRRKTKPSRAAREKRLQHKKQRGEIKQSRRQRFE